MKKGKIIFKQILQNAQEYGTDDEFMVSVVFFDLEIEGKIYPDLKSLVKQPVGSSFETSPLEVSKPENYKGPLNYSAFRDAVEDYFREQIGARGRGIRIVGGGNITMINNMFVSQKIVEFDIKSGDSGW